MFRFAMARGRATFRQQDVTRALRAATAAGHKPTIVRIDRDGVIELKFSPEPEPDAGDDLLTPSSETKPIVL